MHEVLKKLGIQKDFFVVGHISELSVWQGKRCGGVFFPFGALIRCPNTAKLAQAENYAPGVLDGSFLRSGF